MCTYLIQVKCIAGHYVNAQTLVLITVETQPEELQLHGMNPNLNTVLLESANVFEKKLNLGVQRNA